MPNKTIKTRIIQKHAVEADWLKATNFIPLKGELIIYDADATYTYPRFKVGDGITNVNDLPVSDIVDNLTTNISTKPLSAAQGVVLKTQNDKKINLPETDGTVNYGTAGQFAVSDGAGGITWQTINNGDEVNY